MAAKAELSDQELQEQVRALLYKNMIAGRKGGYNFHYTKPSPGTYPFQYFWDTCFHVFTLTALGEVDMAKKHLKSLFGLQQRNGFVGHIIYWKRVLPARLTDIFQLSPPALLKLFKPRMTSLIQPPLVAQATQCVFAASQDTAFLQYMLPKLKAYYQWLIQNRDFEGEGLLSIISPYESGIDWKPSFDPVLGFKPQKASPLLFLKVLRTDLSNFLAGYNLSRIYRRQKFILKEVAFNTIYAQNLQALAALCQVLNDPEASYFQAQAEKTARSILRYMYDSTEAAFFDLTGPDFKKIKIATPTIFFPIGLSLIPEKICREILERHFTHSDGFQVPFPLPSVSVQEPTFNPSESLYIWRGPTWIAYNWFLCRFFRNRGFKNEATQLRQSTRELIIRSGFREYYNPFTGEGYGAHDFTWSGLVLDMIN